MAQENPFKSWDAGLASAHDLHRLEKALTRQEKGDNTLSPSPNETTPKQSSASVKKTGRKKTLSKTQGSSIPAPPVIDQGFVENLADLIAQSLGKVFEEKNLFADRFKLEELKLDNEVMAKHIYTLMQKRGIQDQQLEHLQREQNRWKHLFWKFYLRKD